MTEPVSAVAEVSPRRLRPVADADVYFQDPTWRILHCGGYFCSSPDGRLLSLWGAGDADISGVETLLAIYRAVERAGLGPRRQLVVLRHLTSVSAGAMTRFVRYHETVTTYMRGVSHEALVRPGGVAGIFAEGFYRTMKVPATGQTFTDLDDAAAWIGVTDRDWLAAMEAEEARLLAATRQTPPGLEALWAPHYMRLTLADAAATLGLSPRSLQRRLREANTSFEALREAATMNHADDLLLAGEDIKAVAFTLGFASSSAFSAAFRRSRGMSPEPWRQALRARA